MPDINNIAIEKQVYSVKSHANQLARVDQVILSLSPCSMQVAGYNDAGEVITIRHYGYENESRAWLLDFFEGQFKNEPLLSNNQKISAVFVTAEKNMLIPKPLFSEGLAQDWLKQLYFIENDEEVYDYILREDKAHYLFTIPLIIKELIGRHFPKAKILPFAAHQFNKSYKTNCVLQCSLTSDEAYITLYQSRHLQSHKVLPYDTVEDIAYNIKLLFQQRNIEQERPAVICAISHNKLTGLIDDLSQYFHELQAGNGNIGVEDEEWKSTVYLFQQLYACVL